MAQLLFLKINGKKITNEENLVRPTYFPNSTIKKII